MATLKYFGEIFILLSDEAEAKPSQDSKSIKNAKEFCDICGRQFDARKNLLQHKLLHTQDKCICKICGGFYHYVWLWPWKGLRPYS